MTDSWPIGRLLVWIAIFGTTLAPVSESFEARWEAWGSPVFAKITCKVGIKLYSAAGICIIFCIIWASGERAEAEFPSYPWASRVNNCNSFSQFSQNLEHNCDREKGFYTKVFPGCTFANEKGYPESWRNLVLCKGLCFIGAKWGTGVSEEGLASHIPWGE